MKLAERTKPTKFIKLGNDHYGTGTGVTVIREKCFAQTAWNAAYNNFNVFMGCTLDNICDNYPLKLDKEIQDCIIPVPIVVAEGNGVSTLHTIYRLAFPLSCTEVGLLGWQTEGTAFAYFNSNSRRIGRLEDTNTAVYWGLRSPYSGADSAYCVDTDGTLNYYGVYDAFFAARPAFNLKSSIVVSDSTDSDGCYTIESVPGKTGGLYVKNNGVWVQAA